jgi:small conductance mechanosensitive channel
MINIVALVLPLVKSIALALGILVLGWMGIKKLMILLKVYIEKTQIDATLKPFIISIVDALLKVLLALSIIGILGVDTTSFAAVLGAAGLAVGLAFQGSLSNFAGGVLLLSLRPFKVGDYIEANGYSGTVEAIQILYTQLNTPDNKVIFIPNGSLANNSIVNYSVKETRRVDLTFGVGYEQEAEKVKKVLEEICNTHPLVLQEPQPFIRMSSHGESAIVFTVRVWVNTPDYWSVYFDLMENVKKRFDEEGIAIPYPQMDIHLHQ